MLYFAHIVSYHWHKYLRTADSKQRACHAQQYEAYMTAMCGE